MRLKKDKTGMENTMDVALPHYQTAGSAGMDICSDETVCIGPGEWACVSTAIAIALPEGFEAQIRSRSGLALHHGVVCLNAPGTIDSDYRGEIKVILINHGKKYAFMFRVGCGLHKWLLPRYVGLIGKKVFLLHIAKEGKMVFGSSGME